MELIVLQILLVIKYLDDCGVLHRDFKPENILVEEDFTNIRVCDFGLARTVDIKQHYSNNDEMEERVKEENEQQ